MSNRAARKTPINDDEGNLIVALRAHGESLLAYAVRCYEQIVGRPATPKEVAEMVEELADEPPSSSSAAP